MGGKLVLFANAHSQRGAEREENQDTIGIQSRKNYGEKQESIEMMFSKDDLPALFLLADGIGGHSDGKLASRTVVDTICRIFRASPDSFDATAAIWEAHIALTLFNGYSERPMGTTIVGVLIDPVEAKFFNVGDSKAHLIKGTKIQELSIEDRHPASNGNVITQCLGGGTPRPNVHQASVRVEPGDKFLLSSDGVTDHVSDKMIYSFFSNKHSISAQDICETALSFGSGDDISAIIIEI